jgi:hypothetical protein
MPQAPDVDVELIQTGIVSVARQLDLEFHLVLRHGQLADHANDSDTGPPQLRSCRRLGIFPLRIAARAFSRTIDSSGIDGSMRTELRQTGKLKARCQGGETPGASTREPGGRRLQSTPGWAGGFAVVATRRGAPRLGGVRLRSLGDGVSDRASSKRLQLPSWDRSSAGVGGRG